MTTPAFPTRHTLRGQADPVAAGATTSTAILAAPGDRGTTYTVTAVRYMPPASVTGANGNSRTLRIVNRKGDGSGATIVGSLQLLAGTNLAADTATPFVLSGTPADLTLVGGDVLSFESIAVGSGLADPGGTVEIIASRAT